MESNEICDKLNEVKEEFDNLSNGTISLMVGLEDNFLNLAATYKLIDEGNADIGRHETPVDASKLFVGASEKLDEVLRSIGQLNDLCQRLLEKQRKYLKKEEGK